MLTVIDHEDNNREHKFVCAVVVGIEELTVPFPIYRNTTIQYYDENMPDKATEELPAMTAALNDANTVFVEAAVGTVEHLMTELALAKERIRQLEAKRSHKSTKARA